jgi:CheY-like chemotaxis protein
MGGKVLVSSKLGVGSKFSLVLSSQIVREEIKIGPESVTSMVKPEYRSKPILVVDDVEMNRRVMKACLLQLGFHNIDEAPDGLEAVEMTKSQFYDLILMDIFMPKMNGIDAAEIIRTLPNYKDTKILAVTASCIDDSRLFIMNSLFDVILAKPLHLEELQSAITNHCKVEFDSISPKKTDWNLLLVDDQPSMRRLITLTLRGNGIEVEQAASGTEGLEKLSKGHYDMVLLDRVMPEIDGFETARRMKTHQPTPPIFIMSSDFSSEDYEIGNRIGISGFLEKPIRPGDVRRILSNVR